MTVIRGIVVGLIGVMLLLTGAACQSAAANASLAETDSQAGTPVSTPVTPLRAVVWGKVPYCNCLATSATANVVAALKEARLTVNLKELSPTDGWLYFAVNFDPAAVTGEQVATAMQAGGAEVVDGPP